MLSFLKTALETLNIELKNLSLNKNDEIVNVDVEDIKEESQKPKSCGCKNSKSESCGCQNKSSSNPNKFGDDVKKIITGFKKELEEMEVEKELQDNLIRMTFDITDYTGEDKKILLDKLKMKSEAAIDFIKSNNKLQLNEEDEQDLEKDVKKSNKKKPEEEENETEEISQKEKDIKINNFKVFFDNYLTDDVGYTSEDAEFIISFILNHVKKFADNKEYQTKFNRELSELIGKIKNSYKDIVEDNKSTKNYDIAMDNLSKISVLFNNWGKNNSQDLKSNLLQMASISDNVQIQKSIVSQISKINKKYKKVK